MTQVVRRVKERNRSYANIRLDSGESILISLASGQDGGTHCRGIIFKLAFFGWIPIKRLWTLDGLLDFVLSDNEEVNTTSNNCIDYLIKYLGACHSVDEVIKKCQEARDRTTLKI